MSPSKLESYCEPEVRPLWLDRNDQNESIFRYVPGLAKLHYGPVPGPGYRGGAGCPDTARLLRQVAEHEGVPAHAVRLIGSALPTIRQLANRLGCSTVVTLSLDFPKYRDTAALSRLGHYEIAVGPGSEPVSAEVVAERVRHLGRALFFVTVPRLNPGGNLVSWRVIKAALDANPELIIVLDAAYQRCAPVEHTIFNGLSYSQHALIHPRLAYLQTANKHIGSLCAFKIGWFIASTELLRLYDQFNPDPYAMPADGAARLSRLIGEAEILQAMTDIQMSAKEILVKKLSQLGYPLLAKEEVPWTLVYLGKDVISVADQLIEKHIYTQVQSISQLSGYIRVSATTPIDVQRFIKNLRRIKRNNNRDIIT